MSFFGATDTPVFFWGHLLWVTKPQWVLPCSLFCEGDSNVHSLRSTSGATCADLLAAGSASGHFPTCTSRGRLEGGSLLDAIETPDFLPSHLHLPPTPDPTPYPTSDTSILLLDLIG